MTTTVTFVEKKNNRIGQSWRQMTEPECDWRIYVWNGLVLSDSFFDCLWFQMSLSDFWEFSSSDRKRRAPWQREMLERRRTRPTTVKHITQEQSQDEYCVKFLCCTAQHVKLAEQNYLIESRELRVYGKSRHVDSCFAVWVKHWWWC